jgi:hypothetical protein
MFITNKAFRSSISAILADPVEQRWTVTEMPVDLPWFLVTFRHVESIDGSDAFEITRTVLLSDLKDLEPWAHLETEGSLHLESVQVITPGYVNGTHDWKMDPLKAVWTAEEPSVAGEIVEIYETTAGVKYAYSFLETPISELQNETLQNRFTHLGDKTG